MQVLVAAEQENVFVYILNCMNELMLKYSDSSDILTVNMYQCKFF